MNKKSDKNQFRRIALVFSVPANGSQTAPIKTFTAIAKIMKTMRKPTEKKNRSTDVCCVCVSSAQTFAYVICMFDVGHQCQCGCAYTRQKSSVQLSWCVVCRRLQSENRGAKKIKSIFFYKIADTGAEIKNSKTENCRPDNISCSVCAPRASNLLTICHPFISNTKNSKCDIYTCDSFGNVVVRLNVDEWISNECSARFILFFTRRVQHNVSAVKLNCLFERCMHILTASQSAAL